MTPRFADTSYYLAVLGPTDVHHAKAVALSRVKRARYVTTEYVLLEVGNALHRSADRGLFVALVAGLSVSPTTTILPASADLWQRGNALYAARPDKDWSLTDCISFVVMGELGLTDALTADHHFAQAGFTPLLA